MVSESNTNICHAYVHLNDMNLTFAEYNCGILLMRLDCLKTDLVIANDRSAQRGTSLAALSAGLGSLLDASR